MDLDDDELKATRKLKGLDKNIFEDLEIQINTLYSNCRNEKELNKISFKECSKRKKELKNGII